MRGTVRLGRAEIAGPLELLDEVGVVVRDPDRGLQLRAARERVRRADLGDDDLAQLFLVAHQRVVQLTKAARPEGVIGRPRRRVEGAACRLDGPLRVAYRRVGGGTEDRAGRRVDRLERAIALSRDQLAVDEQAFLVPHERKLSSHIGRIK